MQVIWNDTIQMSCTSANEERRKAQRNLMYPFYEAVQEVSYGLKNEPGRKFMLIIVSDVPTG